MTGLPGLSDGRRRWTVRCRDLLSRQATVVIEVDATGAICLHMRGAAVLDTSDVRRLQGRLGDALARALADGADWPEPGPEQVTMRIPPPAVAQLRRLAAAEAGGDLTRLLLQLVAEALRHRARRA